MAVLEHLAESFFFFFPSEIYQFEIHILLVDHASAHKTQLLQTTKALLYSMYYQHACMY
jgi:hypothetical protein